MRSPSRTAYLMSVARTTTSATQSDTFFSVCHRGRWHRGHKLRSLGTTAPHSVQLVEAVSIPRRLLGRLPILRKARLFQAQSASVSSQHLQETRMEVVGWNIDAPIRL